MQNPYKKKSAVNPQSENGHRRINNEVYHALTLYPFTGAELRVVLVAIDRTWGWDQKSATISIQQFADATNLSRQGIMKTLKSLAEKKVLVIHHAKAPKQSEYLFNKHFDTWLNSQPALSIIIPQPEQEQLTLDGQPQLSIEKSNSQPQLSTNSQPQLSIIANQGLLSIDNWPDRALKLLQQGIQQYITTKDIKHLGSLKPAVLEGLINKHLFNQLRAKVFELLKEKRGYNSPNAGAEAKAITWMLKQDYSVTDIMKAHQVMSQQPFWKEKEVLMTSVKGQIGKIKKGGGGGLATGEELAEAWK